MAREHNPIDAVIAWVDGSDAEHARKRAHYASPDTHASSQNLGRFDEVGELLYCVGSIFAFAPFVRNIVILSDDQVPSYLDQIYALRRDARERVQFASHREIFKDYEEFLPVFNSRTIETMLHRIDGLSERFLYFNDDTMLSRPSTHTTFFDGDLPIVRGRWRSFRLRSHIHLRGYAMQRRSGRAGNTRGQELGAWLAGQRWRYVHAEHVPQPMRRSTLRSYFEAHPDTLRTQLAHRFRSPEQFVPTALARHLELRWHARLGAPFIAGYLRPMHAANSEHLQRTLHALEERAFDTFCVQELSQFGPTVREAIFESIRRTLDGSYRG